MKPRIEFIENDVRLVIHKAENGLVRIEVYYPDGSGYDDSEDFEVSASEISKLL